MTSYVEVEKTNSSSYTSFSRLEAFKKCSEFYHLKYVEKIKEEKPFNKHLEMGALVHAVLGDYLEGVYSTMEDSFYFHLGAWLKKMNLLTLNDDLDDLIESIEPAAHILWRASRKCDDEDLLIRKDNGDLLKDPINYPSKNFKKICYQEGVTVKFGDLDREARSSNEAFIETSFSWLVARSLYLTKYFEIPKWVKKTAHVEIGISTEESNRVNIPNTDKPLQGYIDWIVELEDGRLLLLDHKTSKNKPTPLEVFLHPQLNAYAWLYEKIYGRFVDLIGINHLESGEYVVCSTNKDVAQSTMNYYSEVQQPISEGLHFKHSPLDYNSPCLKRDWKSGRITETCPFLSHCHPIFDKLKE